MPPIYIMVAIFCLGAIIGSFLNVCIFRIPAGVSIVKPASRCQSCQAPIYWYQNIPILSYLVLRGRCSSCGSAISMRYPLVELLTGLLFAMVFQKMGMTLATPIYWLLTAALVVITFIDLDHQIIPDVISLPGTFLGFFAGFFNSFAQLAGFPFGHFAGRRQPYLVAKMYYLLTKVEGMGGGDVKLLAMIGAFLGWKAILPIIFLGSLSGSLVGVPFMLLKKAGGKLAIPFGPFLALGAVIYLLYGQSLVGWYLSLVLVK